jgi:hypothetical protein
MDAQEEPHWKTREEDKGRDEECRSAGAYLLDFRRRKFVIQIRRGRRLG